MHGHYKIISSKSTQNELEKNMEDDLLKYMKKVEARTFDDYRKAEGLMVDSITLPDGIEIKEKE